MVQDTKTCEKSHIGIEKILSEPQRVTVPFELILHCWHAKKINQLKIFLTLKLHTTGRIKLDKPWINSIMGLCGIRTERTFKKHLDWLIQNHWVCIDQKNSIVFIKSFPHVYQILNLQSTQSVLIRYEVIRDFRIWCASIIVAKKIREIFWRLSYRDRNKGRRSVKGKLTSKNFYPGLSDSKVAKLLRVSEKEAWKLKRQANKLGFLIVNRRFKCISDAPHTLLYGMHGRYQVFKGKVWERSYDEIKHDVKFGRKKLCKKVV